MRKVSLLLGLLLLGACDPYTVPAGKNPPTLRYVVVRSDRQGIDSMLTAIETVKDRQTGDCYMVLMVSGGGMFAIPAPCDTPRAEQ